MLKQKPIKLEIEVVCETCRGKGKLYVVAFTKWERFQDVDLHNFDFMGIPRYRKQNCDICNGTGKITEIKEVLSYKVVDE
jgi:DnaJ-class molecular chaperone